MNDTPDISVVSAAPQAPLSKEEKAKRYAAYRRTASGSRFAVKGLPGLHYFWAPKDDSSEMTRLDIVGYTIVREPNVKEVLAGNTEPKIRAGGLREDGTYVIGDVILTSCPEESYEFALMDVSERHDELQASAKESFLLEAEKQGVPTFTFSK